MKKLTLAALATAALVAIPTTAHALPTATFAVETHQTLGTAYTYDATASVCDLPPCSYSWRFYRTSSYDRLGSTLGFGQVVSYKFGTTGTFAVVLKVTNSGSTHGFSTYTKYVTISQPQPQPTTANRGNDWE